MTVACPSSGAVRALPAPAYHARPLDPDHDLAALVTAARDGDGDAWTQLVKHFDRGLRNIARSYRLAPADVEDVVQSTWLNLFEGIDRIREPAAIAGWLVIATRRHALRRRQAHVREVLSDDPRLGDRADHNEPEARLLELERSAALTDALSLLPDRHRNLLDVLLTRPTLEYREVAELLSMPVGSIGPTRARSIAKLARHKRLRALHAAEAVA
jgi:RNA polymerase sigma factor (sigma-70 family)